jgi:DNA polymerase III epsilon subunit-like protein
MNFKKDILLIDTEFSGFDIQKHEVLQIAAILLDRKTLKEKKAFSTFIKPTRWSKRDRACMKVNKITLDMVKDAPSLEEALRLFDKTFGHNVIQAFYVGYNDKRFLMESYRRAKIKWQFDYHVFDLWPVFYAHLALKDQLKSKKDFAGFGLEYLIKKLKIKIDKKNLHDALVDCRVEAEVLRKLIKV